MPLRPRLTGAVDHSPGLAAAARVPAAQPRILAELGPLLGTAGVQQRGALWRLSEPGRGLDANVVHLPAGARVDEHVEEAVDVLLVVVAGSGVLGPGPDATGSALTPGVIVWLPRAAPRSLRAGDQGLTYLTVHTRRPALDIGRPRALQQASGPASAGATTAARRTGAGRGAPVE
ncbi:hypothetical protein ACF059_07145 [Streptomyces sp. NPDC016562]|uniref:hypothetical protein n=1 Tax=Streptomyces sp. NPDC016562 TaxID=3364966 RepID=UPI0036FF3BAF